ncbi:MAG: flavocytochrome c, partial [Lachnospiraceae bacterium]|nr:flavocytochrome c [Lachnospiraceae bacterium]
MKKVVSFLLIAAMALSMIGCGGAADTTTEAPETTKAPVETTAPAETEAPAADLNCEIVVVGAGGAGMVAALQAVENGAESVI